MKRKKKNSTILFLFSFVLSHPYHLFSFDLFFFFLSLSYIIYSYTHGKEEKHFTIVLVLYLPVKFLDRALGMRDGEEKKPMDTSFEVLSWHLRGREIHIPLGPFGSGEGSGWNDGSHQRIESIFVSYSSNFIYSIRAVYKDFNNNIFIAPQRGSQQYTLEAIHLPPETLITRIDGSYDNNGITCLELSTNNGKMCSFGKNAGSPFMFQDPRGFTGFHGRSSGYRLTALGVYVNSFATRS